MVTASRLRSRVMVGTVHHRRTRHTTYEFSHRVWYLALDLDELDAVSRWLLLAHGRRALLEIRDDDHLQKVGLGLRESVDAHLLEAGLDPASMRVTLVTSPRVAGFVFNPVSFYLCHGDDGALRHVIAEVSNTHGDREIYDFAPQGGSPVFRSTALKRMYVSPFIDADARYDLAVTESATRLLVTITEYEAAELALHASINVVPRPVTTRSLLAALSRDPLIPLKTVALIAWHAARLRSRGVRWQRYRAPVARPTDSSPGGHR